MDDHLNYRDSGVDLEAADESVEAIKELARSTYRSEVMQDIGGFSGMFSFDREKYSEPVLVSGTDGVGTKLKLAFSLNKHDTIGEDCVAMCVNDLLVQGAEPLFFLDYLAVGEMESSRVKEIVRGIAEGCKKAGCALLGGETAEMPGFYPPGEYEMAGFAVGVVEKKHIIDGSRVEEGDSIIGIFSNGVHSNGFSLVRKIIDSRKLSLKELLPETGVTLGDELLKPTQIYVKQVLSLLDKFDIKGMAHITGGGMPGNIDRVLPKGLNAIIDSTRWSVPEVFTYLQKKGNVETKEMFNVFNMGIGYILVCKSSEAGDLIKELKDKNLSSRVIGEIEKGKTGKSAEVFIK